MTRQVGTSRLVKSKHIADRIIEGKAIIVTPDSMMHQLSEVGTRIWQLLDAHSTIEAIAARLVEEFDVSEDDARKDVAALAKDLQQKKIVFYEKGA